MRILYLSTSMELGGAEQQVAEIVRRMAKRGHETRVLSLTPISQPHTMLTSSGIRVESLGMRPGLPDIRGMMKLRRVLATWQPDILHSHMVHANLLARLTRLFVTVPVLISTAHNIDEGGRGRELAYRLTDPLCTLTTNICLAGTERYIRVNAVPAQKIRWVPNGVDTQRFTTLREARDEVRQTLGIAGTFAWLALGRLEVQKDYPTLLRAFATLHETHAATHLLIAGKGVLAQALQSLASELHLDDSVMFLGARQDIPQLMSAVDAFVMSSAWEGLPLVLLEAACCRLPIVATAVGGNPEIVIDGKGGYLVPARNPAVLAASMARLMSLTTEERQAFGTFNQRHAQTHYDINTVIDQWEALYTELLTHAA